MEYFVIDVGGTNIKAGEISKEASIAARKIVQTPYSTPEEYIETLVSLVEKKYKGIGVCVPGFVDSKNGICKTGGSLEYLPENFPLKKILEERLDCPVTVENDARCAGMAELWKGALSGIRNAFVLVFGTAIGMSAFLDGKMYCGSHGQAMEPGYMMNISVPGNMFGITHGVNGLCRKVSELTGVVTDGKQLMHLYAEKDPEIMEIVDKYFEEIAMAIYNMQMILDVDRVAIGGGISRSSVFVSGIQKAFSDIYRKSRYPLPQPDLVPCFFYNDANMIGALYRHLYL